MTTNIDFTKIRGDAVEGQRAAFEQLVCHLARLDNRFAGAFRRIEGAGGDGGVEAIRIRPGGREIGFQAKYYPNRDEIDWPKIDQSVEQALKHHPRLNATLFRCHVILPARAARAAEARRAFGEGGTRR